MTIISDLQIRLGNDIKLEHMSRRTLVRYGDQNFKQDMLKLKQSIENVLYVSTTADMWSYRNRRVIGSTLNHVNN